MQEYVLRAAQFDSLATGYGDAGAIELLADSQRNRRRLLLVAAAGVVRRMTGPHADLVLAAMALLISVEQRAPAVGREFFRHPYLVAWYGQLVRGTPDRSSAAAGYLAGLAVVAAARAAVPFTVVLPVRGADLLFPGLGTAVDLGPGPVEVFGDGTALTLVGPRRRLRLTQLGTAEGDGWLPVRTIRLSSGDRSLDLSVEDADPYRDRFSARPMTRLSTMELDRLREHCQGAWQLLVAQQPEHVGTAQAVFRSIVPVVSAGPAVHLSATARDAFGTVALSLPSNPEHLAELLIHELQHAKLGALLDLVDLHRVGGAARFYAPWRPDPRPAGPLLQGIYSYVGVCGFWRALRRVVGGRGDVQFAYWRDQTAYALDRLIESDELTPDGTTFAGRLRATLTGWLAEPVDPAARREAARRADADRERWRSTNPVTAL